MSNMHDSTNYTEQNSLPAILTSSGIGALIGYGSSFLSEEQKKHKLRNTLLGAAALPATYLGFKKLRPESDINKAIDSYNKFVWRGLGYGDNGTKLGPLRSNSEYYKSRDNYIASLEGQKPSIELADVKKDLTGADTGYAWRNKSIDDDERTGNKELDQQLKDKDYFHKLINNLSGGNYVFNSDIDEAVGLGLIDTDTASWIRENQKERGKLQNAQSAFTGHRANLYSDEESGTGYDRRYDENNSPKDKEQLASLERSLGNQYDLMHGAYNQVSSRIEDLDRVRRERLTPLHKQVDTLYSQHEKNIAAQRQRVASEIAQRRENLEKWLQDQITTELHKRNSTIYDIENELKSLRAEKEEDDDYDAGISQAAKNRQLMENIALPGTGISATILALKTLRDRFKSKKKKPTREINPEEYINYLEEEGLA